MSTRRIQNPPRKHHYLPEFYLQRWANADGKLVQYSQPIAGKLVANWRTPGGTGFEKDGYSIPGLPPEMAEAQVVESDFFGPIDSEAARVINKLDDTDGQAPSNPEDRTRWAKFLMTMLMRSPEDVAAVKAGMAKAWADESPARRAAFQARFPPESGYIYEQYMAETPDHFTGQMAMRAFMRMNSSEETIKAFKNMHHFFVKLEPHFRTLLTSDRPLFMSSYLADPSCYLLMPVGPKWLYIASREMRTQASLSEKPAELFREINKACVKRAVRFVYAQDKRDEPFVGKHFGKGPTESCIQALERTLDEARNRGVVPFK